MIRHKAYPRLNLGHKNITHTVRYTRTAASRFEGMGDEILWDFFSDCGNLPIEACGGKVTARNVEPNGFEIAFVLKSVEAKLLNG